MKTKFSKTVAFITAVLVFALPISLQMHDFQASLEANTAHAGWLSSTFEEIKASLFTLLYAAATMIFLMLPSFVAITAGKVFNWFFTETVLNFGTFYHQNLADGINMAWSLSQGMANLIIVSMFMFAAIATVLRIDNYNLEKFIVKLLVVAILINFSMFFSKLAVDVSNVVARQVYLISGSSKSQNLANINIGNVIYNKLGVNKFMFDKKFVEEQVKNGKEGKGFFTIIMLSLVLTFLAGTLIYGTVVMATRALGLLLIIALSAAGFVAMIVPGPGKKMFEKWWLSLVKYSLFAPMFSFMLLVILIIIQKLGSGKTIADSIMNSSYSEGFLMSFLLVGLLMASIKISDSLSIAGSKFAIKYGAGTAMSLAMLPSLSLGGAAKKAALEFYGRTRLGTERMRLNALEKANKSAGWRTALGDLAITKSLAKKTGLDFGGMKDLKQKPLSDYEREKFDKLKKADKVTAEEREVNKLLKEAFQHQQAKTQENTDSKTESGAITNKNISVDTEPTEGVAQGEDEQKALEETTRKAEKVSEQAAKAAHETATDSGTLKPDLNDGLDTQDSKLASADELKRLFRNNVYKKYELRHKAGAIISTIDKLPEHERQLLFSKYPNIRESYEKIKGNMADPNLFTDENLENDVRQIQTSVNNVNAGSETSDVTDAKSDSTQQSDSGTIKNSGDLKDLSFAANAGVDERKIRGNKELKERILRTGEKFGDMIRNNELGLGKESNGRINDLVNRGTSPDNIFKNMRNIYDNANIYTDSKDGAALLREKIERLWNENGIDPSIYIKSGATVRNRDAAPQNIYKEPAQKQTRTDSSKTESTEDSNNAARKILEKKLNEYRKKSQNLFRTHAVKEQYAKLADRLEKALQEGAKKLNETVDGESNTGSGSHNLPDSKYLKDAVNAGDPNAVKYIETMDELIRRIKK